MNTLQKVSLLLLIPILFFQCKSTDTALRSNSPSGESPKLVNQYDSISYAWGVNFADFLKGYHYDSIDLDLMKKGFADAFASDTLPMPIEEVKAMIRAYGEVIVDRAVQFNDSIGKLWIADYAQQDGVTALPSGMYYEVLSEGWSEKQVQVGDRVVVHYQTWTVDGTLVDSSVERMKPYDFAFGASELIKGWEEIIPLMHEGDKYKVAIPQEMAYGRTAPMPGIPPGSTLIYEIKILDIKSVSGD